MKVTLYSVQPRKIVCKLRKGWSNPKKGRKLKNRWFLQGGQAVRAA